MRRLALAALVACGSPPIDAPTKPAPVSTPDAAAPAASTPPPFRWALGPLACGGFEVRSNLASCQVDRASSKLAVIARPSKQAVEVTATTWKQRLELGRDVTSAIVAIHDDDTVTASIAGGVVELARLGSGDGAVKAKRTLGTASAVQLSLVARQRDALVEIRVYRRLADGSGHVDVLDPASLASVSAADVPARAIRETMDRAAQAGDGEITTGAYHAVWHGAAMAIEKPGGWSTTIEDDDEWRMDDVTLHDLGAHVVGTIHHIASTGIQAFAIEAATGKLLWKHGLTGLGSIAHSGYENLASSLVDGDLLVVQSVESFGSFICTVAIAGGAEVACVDLLPKANVVTPPRRVHSPKPMPPETPLGPDADKPSCKKVSSPGVQLTVQLSKTKTSRGNPMIEGTVVTPSSTCKPELGGGIVGDRIELEVWDGGDAPKGGPACTCTFRYKQPFRPESKIVTARVRGGVEIGRIPMPPH